MFGAWLKVETKYSPTKEEREQHHKNVQGIKNRYRYNDKYKFKQIEAFELERMKMYNRQFVIDRKQLSSGYESLDPFTIYHNALVRSYTPQSFMMYNVDNYLNTKTKLFIQNEFMREFQRRTKIEIDVLKKRLERLEKSDTVNKKYTRKNPSSNNKKKNKKKLQKE